MNRAQKLLVFIEASEGEVNVGDTVSATPSSEKAKKYKYFSFEGMVQEIIHNQDNEPGYHIKDKNGDVQRVWAKDYDVQIIKKTEPVQSNPETPSAPTAKHAPKSRVDMSAADLAADYKRRGMERTRAWSEFVKDRALKPEMDAKDFYKIFDRMGKF